MSDVRGLGSISPQGQVGSGQLSNGKTIDSNGPSFQDFLKEKTSSTPEKSAPTLNFSSHAVDRMASRAIRLQAGDVARLEEAVEKARSKGSKDTLLLMGDNAFIVNVKNRTVVTAMDRAMMKENVFTNIDSTIVL